MATSPKLHATDGSPLNARIDLEARGIVLHSRSGVDRNRDYRQALEMLMACLDGAGITYDVFLDSSRVQDQSLESRKLVFSHGAPIPERFNALVRAMNAGTASHGAWRRILITTPGYDAAALETLLKKAGTRELSEIARLPASQLRRVKPEHIDRSVVRLTRGEDASNFAPSRDFDLIATNGERLAPKKVFGLALEEALSIEARPEHFSAGRGTPCFELLEAAGYPIVRKGETIPGNAVEPVDPDLAAAEGQPKLVAHLKRERKPALAAAKRRAMIEELGHLKCERCSLVPSDQLGPYGDAVIEVHHATTQVSDMGPGHVTRLSDLTCLCANCHRIVHRELVS